MANEQGFGTQQAGQLLRQILTTLPSRLKAAGKATVQSDPTAILAQILGSASVDQTQAQPTVGASKKAGQALEERAGQLNPMQENVLKSVMKVHKEQVEEAMAAGASGEQIIKDAGMSIADNQPTDDEGKPEGSALALDGVQPPELAAGQPPSQGFDLAKFLGLDFSKGLMQQPGISPEGVATPGTALFGLLQETSGEVLKRQNAQALTPQGRLQETQLETAKEQFKQDRQDQREVLKAQLKAAGADDVAAGLTTLAKDVIDLTEARSQILGRGRLTGRVGGLISAFGPQRDKRAVVESFAEALLFSFGEHIIGQKGRAFVKDEQERVKKNVIGAVLSESDNVFNARMDAIIQKANARLPEGAAPIPNIKSLLGSQTAARTQTQPGVQEEIDAINKRLGELGGQ